MKLVEKLLDRVGVGRAAVKWTVCAYTFLVPVLHHVNHVASKDRFAVSNERGRSVRPHFIEDLKNGLGQEPNFKEQVREPGLGTKLVLLIESIGFEEGDDHIGRKGCFGAIQSLCHVADLGDDSFIGVLSGARFIGSVVYLVEKRLPSCADISIIAVVGNLVDLEADIVVVCSISV